MANGGIIFLSILALWAVYLVPVLVRERASRLDSRAGDRTSPAVRVLQRPPAQRPSHRVVLTADRPMVSADLPARPTRDLARLLRAEARRSRAGVRARAVGALLGVVGLLVCGVAAVAGALPWWSLAVAAGWLTGVLAAGAVAAAQRRNARSAPPVHRSAALPPRARRVATEVFDGRVARLSAAPAATATADLDRPVVEPQAPAAEQDVDRTWTPVEVPGPVYATKPASHRPPALPWSMPPAVTADDADAEGGTADATDAPADGSVVAGGEPAGTGSSVASAGSSQVPGERYDEVGAEQRHSAAG